MGSDILLYGYFNIMNPVEHRPSHAINDNRIADILSRIIIMFIVRTGKYRKKIER